MEDKRINKNPKSKCTTIPAQWLSRIDVLGHRIESWGRKVESTILFCEICMCHIHCATKGYQAISQHAASAKHKQNADVKLNTNQLHLGLTSRAISSKIPFKNQNNLQEPNIQSISSSSVSSFSCSSSSLTQSNTKWNMYTSQEKAIVAELLWTMKCILSNFSSLSCDGIENLFRAMFSTGYPDTFSLSKKKVGYLQTDCLGPYFHKLVSEDAQKGSFVVCYDETTNSEGMKELQISIRFWSEILNEVIFCHLQTFFLGHATAVILKDCIFNALKNSNLSLCKILMLSCDGPNINKSVIRQVNEAVRKENDGIGLIDILSLSTAKHFRCLLPSEIKKDRSFLSAEKIVKMLSLNQISISTFLDEWKILQKDNLPAWDGGRIDHYWRQIFDLKNNFNEPKYPNIQKMMKAALSLAHGSSDVERNFSISARVLTDDKSRMTERTLNAKLNIKTGLKYFNGKPEMVPMTKDLIISARFAHSKYKEYLEEKKKSEEEEKRRQKSSEKEAQRRSELLKKQNKARQDIEELEKKVKEAKKTDAEEKAASDSLLQEARERLKEALDGKDLQGAKVAYGMLEGAVSIREQLKSSDIESLQKKLDNKKSCLITSFFVKQNQNI